MNAIVKTLGCNFSIFRNVFLYQCQRHWGSLFASVQIWIDVVKASSIVSRQNQLKWAQNQTRKVTLVSLSKTYFFWLPFRFGP